MRHRLKIAVGFLNALPTLPFAVWSQRHEIVNALFGRHVWLGKKGRAAYEQHQADYEQWRTDLHR